jgi:hypothetical protein
MPQCSAGTALASAAGIPLGRRHVDKVYHQVMSRLPFVWDYDIDEPGVSATLLHGFGRFMLQNFISLPSM